MNRTVVFAIRLVAAVLFSLLASRVYFGSVSPGRVMLFAAVLLGLAYVFEYARKKNGNGGKGHA